MTKLQIVGKIVAGVVLTTFVVFIVGCGNYDARVRSVPATQIQVDFKSIYTKSVQAIMEARYSDAVRLFEAVELHTHGLAPKAKAAYLIQRAQAEAMLFKGREAIQHLTEADSITRRYGLDSLRCLMYNAYGIMSQNTESDRYGALEYYIQGINLAKSVGYDYMRAVLSANAAWLFLLDRDMSGLVYAEWCYKYAIDHGILNTVYCGALTTAQFYILQKRFNEADSMLIVAENAAIECNVADLTELYMAFGDLHTASGNYELAIDYYQKAVSYKDVAMVDYTFFAYVHYAELLLMKGNNREAINELKNGLQFVEHHYMQIERPRAYNTLSFAYEKLGKSDSASYYRTKGVIEEDLLHRRDIANVRKNVISKYEQQSKLAMAEMELRTVRERFWIYLTAFLLLLSAFIAIVISRNRLVCAHRQLVARELEWNKEKECLFEQGVVEIEPLGLDDPRPKFTDNEKLLFERIDKLMRIDKLFKDPYLGRDKLAELLQTNRTYISKAINSVRGESVSRYIAIYRLEEASKILSDVDDNIPIKDIATELGFTSLSTFYSLFKERYKMSPDKFRKYARETKE